ncbi:hypothetical protein Patl1_24461 [Pistacia atlantica]|uniref:Uncharacterized protein n=1 Tax=Pistacia atlantica TaxID=434234 RepID=A0ACC0ZVE3_9ROSI|nr:hypothetical protein Patl1_24461 [Pistacia atlantica]
MELVLLLQTAQLVGPIPKAGAFRLLVLMPFQSVVPPSPDAIAGWMSNNSPSLPHLAVAAGPSGLVQSSSAAAFLKHPRTPTGMNGMDCQSEYFQHLMKRICTGQSDDVSFAGVAHTSNVYSQDNLTKAVVRTLNQGSNVMSMDFHPQQQDILLGPGIHQLGLALLALNATMLTSFGNGNVVKGIPREGHDNVYAPTSVTTYLAFHPQDNNIIAIGMEDSTIQIYNIELMR